MGHGNKKIVDDVPDKYRQGLIDERRDVMKAGRPLFSCRLCDFPG
jgi:hypothetical protein